MVSLGKCSILCRGCPSQHNGDSGFFSYSSLSQCKILLLIKLYLWLALDCVVILDLLEPLFCLGGLFVILIKTLIICFVYLVFRRISC